jgi:hypothetical protein
MMSAEVLRVKSYTNFDGDIFGLIDKRSDIIDFIAWAYEHLSIDPVKIEKILLKMGNVSSNLN